MKTKLMIVSGYFNPIHKGHIEYFKIAKSLCNYLVVIVNNDLQRELKGSKKFMSEDERSFIVSELKSVDEVFLSIDKDKTVIESIKQIHKRFSSNHEIYFANGGDQDNNSMPEKKICSELNIKLVDGLGDKVQSSSWLIK